MQKKELEALRKLYAIIKRLPFGETTALPWCRESFVELDQTVLQLDELYAEMCQLE